MHIMASRGSCDRKAIEMIAFYNLHGGRLGYHGIESLQFESRLIRGGLKQERRTHVRLHICN